MNTLMQFKTRNVDISGRSPSGMFYNGKADVTWTMNINQATWGVFSWGLKIIDQELTISYSFYNKETGDDEDVEEIIQIAGETIDCKMNITTGAEDFMLNSLDLVNKKALFGGIE